MDNIYLKTACLGVIAGMRSMAAPALVSAHLARTQPKALAETPLLRWFGTPQTAAIFRFLAAGEIVGDKLPMTPDRIAPGPLFGRVVSGGLSGAALWVADGKRAEAGVLLGAVSAAAGAFGFYHLRRLASQSEKFPDPVLGAAEDALAFSVGWNVLRAGES